MVKLQRLVYFHPYLGTQSNFTTFQMGIGEKPPTRDVKGEILRLHEWKTRRGQLRRQAAAALRLPRQIEVKELATLCFLSWNWSTRRRQRNCQVMEEFMDAFLFDHFCFCLLCQARSS